MTSLLLLALAAAPLAADRALPPVVGDVTFKAGRFELEPLAAFSLRDAYYRKYVVGLEAAWHFTDWLSLGGFGGYAITRAAGAVHLCDEAGCAAATAEQLQGLTPGSLGFLAGAEVQLAPFYGKVSFLAETFGNFDFHLRAGVALVGYGAGSLSLAPGAKAGLGARYFLTHWLALRLDLDDVIYPERLPISGVPATVVRNQLFLQVGIAFFIGGGSS
ncbi:MAG: outer membrane beta-barrel domain-containing protein [Archangiaceae bacterium]|nr:outer membrane beta-barrel domain-containing protein [Archangiaceae bacterium]